MNITKNGFYKLSEILKTPLLRKEGLGVVIENNLVVAIFDDLNKSYDVEVGENSKVEIFGVLKNEDDFKLQVLQKEDRSNLILNYLILSFPHPDKGRLGGVFAKIESKLQANFIKSNVNILSIVGNEGVINLDGIIKIEEEIEKVDGNLVEENIFLGDTGKVLGIPTLLVRSDDVKASHACKMERISDEKLFYLRSRGLGRENALNMIIEAKIESLFSCLRMYDKDYYEKVIENILKII
ncbi:MAG: SufD family Fe-S cluster assembly protein [Candidatus Gracilibacteria bacterium]|nr:SufD family Fe-S cluster assembly protein [Candidatus Gracilibacteria bacterium]MDQ7022869.1 SufD family Fe-S cluster assembly protein [Candidatus Gracilibacteria bacterium]